jgi:hypothetical protein
MGISFTYYSSVNDKCYKETDVRTAGDEKQMVLMFTEFILVLFLHSGLMIRRPDSRNCLTEKRIES